MDFGKFSDVDFGVKEWVNGALAAHKGSQTSLDVHASTLVMKLQLAIQEVNSSLEETSCTMLQNLPRVLRDVEAVKQEATLLREQMQIVKEDIKKVEKETAQSMQKLVELDSIKGRMHSSLEALQEADNWTTLSADVEEVFSSQDIAKIAEKLAGMQQSLQVLHDVPDFEERWKFLESLKDRLEALTSPLLITSFNSHSADEAQKYIRIYSDIGRSTQLKNYYVAVHKSGILELWSSLHSLSTPILTYLSTFYDELLTKWHAEFVWCKQVSLDPMEVLPSLFAQSLQGLSPPLGQCLNAAIQSHGDTAPIALLDLRQVVLRFLDGLERAVGDIEYGESGGGMFQLIECIHSPYCQLLVRYPAMETQMLRQQLHGIDMSVRGGLEEGVGVMTGSVPWVFQFASEAVERCVHLTGGWGFNGLLKSLQTLVLEYVSMLSSSVHQLRRMCGFRTGEEWTDLQHAFTLIQVCGDVLLRTKNLSEQLQLAIINSAPRLQDPANPATPFGYYDYLAVYYPQERTAAMELLTSLQSDKGVWSWLSSLSNQMEALNDQAHNFAFDIIFYPLKEKLECVPHLKVWETGATSPLESPRVRSEDLPQFSLSPLPYITEIGDYLLTLPRQLEPFTSQESLALIYALQQGTLPFPEDQPLVREEEGEPHPSDVWLGAVARGTMVTYSQQIILIPSLAQAAAHQLATDIAYLCNVLSALGQVPSQQLVQLEALLKAGEEEFAKLKDNSNIYTCVSKLRTWD